MELMSLLAEGRCCAVVPWEACDFSKLLFAASRSISDDLSIIERCSLRFLAVSFTFLLIVISLFARSHKLIVPPPGTSTVSAPFCEPVSLGIIFRFFLRLAIPCFDEEPSASSPVTCEE